MKNIFFYLRNFVIGSIISLFLIIIWIAIVQTRSFETTISASLGFSFIGRFYDIIFEGNNLSISVYNNELILHILLGGIINMFLSIIINIIKHAKNK